MVPLLGHQLNTFRKFANRKCCYFTALKKDILIALKKIILSGLEAIEFPVQQNKDSLWAFYKSHGH